MEPSLSPGQGEGPGPHRIPQRRASWTTCGPTLGTHMSRQEERLPPPPLDPYSMPAPLPPGAALPAANCQLEGSAATARRTGLGGHSGLGPSARGVLQILLVGGLGPDRGEKVVFDGEREVSSQHGQRVGWRPGGSVMGRPRTGPKKAPMRPRPSEPVSTSFPH
jgi:hypothetical protein